MQQVLKQWQRLHTLPFGKSLFSILTGLMIPYTGSIKSQVVELEPGYAKIQLNERRAIRNHLHSVHAIALANLAEFAGNLALLAGMPDDARFIVKGFTIEYHKKARGLLTAISKPGIVPNNDRREYPVHVDIFDNTGEVVTTYDMQTLVGPLE